MQHRFTFASIMLLMSLLSQFALSNDCQPFWLKNSNNSAFNLTSSNYNKEGRTIEVATFGEQLLVSYQADLCHHQANITVTMKQHWAESQQPISTLISVREALNQEEPKFAPLLKNLSQIEAKHQQTQHNFMQATFVEGNTTWVVSKRKWGKIVDITLQNVDIVSLKH